MRYFPQSGHLYESTAKKKTQRCVVIHTRAHETDVAIMRSYCSYFKRRTKKKTSAANISAR